MHGGLYIFGACHIFYMDYFGRRGEIQSICNLHHHFLAGPDNENPFELLFQKCRYYMVPVVLVVEDSCLYGSHKVGILLCRVSSKDSVSFDQ